MLPVNFSLHPVAKIIELPLISVTPSKEFTYVITLSLDKSITSVSNLI